MYNNIHNLGKKWKIHFGFEIFWVLVLPVANPSANMGYRPIVGVTSTLLIHQRIHMEFGLLIHHQLSSARPLSIFCNCLAPNYRQPNQQNLKDLNSWQYYLLIKLIEFPRSLEMKRNGFSTIRTVYFYIYFTEIASLERMKSKVGPVLHFSCKIATKALYPNSILILMWLSSKICTFL